jgi:signal transduction histidine kinase
MIPARQFFDDSADEIGMDLKNQKIRFEFESDLSDEVRIIADKQQLERVIHNIVSNSVKYMGPKTEADPGRIEMRVSDVGDSVQVELRDNGIGIAPNDLPHIFDRLFRADSSRNSTTGGSGIGLSIVKKIVDDHGGSIWATSTEGAGTTMYFLLRKKMEEKNVKNFDSRRRGSNRKPGERLSGIKRVRG